MYALNLDPYYQIVQSRKKPHAKLEQDEQQPMTVWEASNRQARADMPSRQEKDLNQNPCPIPLPHGSLPFNFITTTSVSQPRISEVRNTWLR
jgi:hypothetical protein